MKTSIVIFFVLLISASLFAGQVHQNSMQAQSFDQTQGSNAAKATGGVINSSAKLIIQSGAYLVIAAEGNYLCEGTGSLPGAGTLDLTGNFVNNNPSAEPVSSTGTINFVGTAAQSISGNPLSLGNVTFANPAGISIGCDTTIEGNLTISETSGTIAMTDYDFGVTGSVTGTPEIVVTGSGAVGDVGENANVTIDSPQPTGLPAIMHTLDINPGAEQSYILPNSTSVAALTFSSGSLSFGSSAVLMRNYDLALSGTNLLSAFTPSLRAEPGTSGDNSSINKTWNIMGQSSGPVTITLRWIDAENNGNDFSSGFANVFAHNGTQWQTVGRYPVSIDSGYNLVSFSRTLGTKDGENDYTITGDEEVLPVTLSSFTAVLTAESYVKLVWTTQSETNVAGYYILRGESLDPQVALLISGLIEATNTSESCEYSYLDTEVIPNSTAYYWLQMCEVDGLSNLFGPLIVLTSDPTNPDNPPIPTQTRLMNAYPNPFNPDTTIPYEIKDPGSVQISIYTCRGQLLRTIQNTHSSPGIYRVAFDGKDQSGQSIASGVYTYSMICGKYSEKKRFVLLK